MGCESSCLAVRGGGDCAGVLVGLAPSACVHWEWEVAVNMSFVVLGPLTRLLPEVSPSLRRLETDV